MTDRYQQTRKVTQVSILVNILLSIIQISIGFIGHSQALIADGIHTLSDLAGDFLVLFAAQQAHREADKSHPYGHGRIETLATVFLGFLLIAVAIGISFDASQRILQPEELPTPSVFTLFATAIVIISKEGLYQYTARVAERINSNLLKANAWHHRSDAISSIIVLLGITAALLGIPSADAIAAVFVALFIARIGFKLGWQGIQELIDAAIEDDKLKDIRNIITDIDGVRNLHMLRSRAMGGQILIDVHIQVAPMISVSEGHQIAETIQHNLINQVPELIDATVHIDPENDENVATCVGLPLRNKLLEDIRPLVAELSGHEELDNAVLHYLSGEVHLELRLPMHFANTSEAQQQLTGLYETALKTYKHLSQIKIYYY